MHNKTTTDALLSFKSTLLDPHGSLASWDNNRSLDYCMWRGVTCGRRHPLQVIALDLDSLGLSGTISPIISNLTFLRVLHLADNQLQGRIPEELGRLSHLRYLNLSANHLQGEIPSTLSHCSHIQSISLGNNKLSGEIPSNLTRCFDLQFLSLYNNTLEGEIPAGIGSLPMLEILTLAENNLTGRIPPLLGSSPSLTVVGLWNNTLSGGIPPFLANSSTLRYLALLDNQYLTGDIPLSFGNSTTLTHLYLGNNNLTGGIPPFVANPSPPLLSLDFGLNGLTGKIPPSLGNLSWLEELRLERNYLEGSIPESLGRLPRLQDFSLSVNRLSGGVPSSLYNISTITYIGGDKNNLSGTLPSDMGLTLPNLQILILSDNQFQGPIPVSLSNASGLEYLELDQNNFSGVIPPDLGLLSNLRSIAFSSNQLQGNDWSFLSSMTNCSLLKRLYLTGNKLEGSLPKTIGDFSTRMERIFLGNNHISGAIPSEIGNLVGLTVLDMSENLFVGPIPATIGKLQNLFGLYLSGNKLSGAIPSAIGNLHNLVILLLQGNELSGIPSSIGSCKNLGMVNLSHNEIGGTITREIFSISSLTQFLDLSHNSLNGSMPMEVGHMINLGRLYVSENKLSGEIPPTLGLCRVLEELHMEGNFFQGNIPQSFQDLKNLKVLDLSRNELSGQIPDFFKGYLSLKSLDLSFNDFEGEIPSGDIFSNASEISVTGNKRLCGSNPELGLTSCSVNAPKGRISLVLVIITAVSAILIFFLCVLGVFYRWKKAVAKGPSPTTSLEKFKTISYADLHKATDGFSTDNLIGNGSFGSVYKGKIDSEESTVAVKVLNLNRKGASKSFTAECEALRNIRHRNLVKIITVCSSMDYRGYDFKALIFEYMPNGSLDKWLHAEVGLEHPKLTLIQRLNIAFDVASALDYLHHSCHPPVIHCDLKPSNVLLDNDMRAHVGDFGLARLLFKSISTASNESTSSIGIKGTVGYVAPEYGMGGEVTTHSDVYSFGVLLLEMLTGKEPTDPMFQDALNLRKYVETAFPENATKILDPQLDFHGKGEEDDYNDMNDNTARERIGMCISSMIRIGLLCSNDAPRERMSMRDVATEIHNIKEPVSMIEAGKEIPCSSLNH